MSKRSFRNLLTRLGIAGALILISFPLGVLAYLHTLSIPSAIPVKNFQEAVDQAATHDIWVSVGAQKFLIKKGEVLQWTESYTRTYSRKKDVRFTSALDLFVANLAQKVNKEPVDARFTINASGSATILVPAQNGQRLNVQASADQLRQGILADATEIILEPEIVAPAVTAEKIASLGVSQRIAVGESNFTGSTLARIQNIKVSSKKYNGLIIRPHETFSFNAVLGDVDASTGYAPEKVIKSGKIQYEYGGGICQVSTTLFRAAVAAGFPIVERKPHAFPVHYYEPQGFDATIYPGVSDMRFTNNTSSPILVQTHILGKNLVFELYGTSDGRTVAIDGPHQYDVQPDGAMKAYLTRTITYADGTSKQDSFYSNYKSPALFPTAPNPYE